MRAIDLFAGAGGFTIGAEAAGVNVVWAANHWPAAVHIHASNHPHTEHSCQDLRQADFSATPDHDIMLASPACQGHSKARGKEQPHHDALRSTAWAVIDCAEAKRPQFVVVENVPEFTEWTLYPSWADALTRLGYSVSPHLLDSAAFGVPQERRRAFIICSLSRAPFSLRIPDLERQPIGPHIDWHWPKWSAINAPNRSLATLSRVAAGRQQYGDRFVAPYYGSGSGKTGRSLDRPLGTVTTRDRWALIDGSRMRMLQVPEYRAAMGFPADYRLPAVRKEAIHMLGNAVCPPVATEICNQLRNAA